MTRIAATLCCLLTSLTSLTSLAEGEQHDDSLKSALDAISRRQRDLATPGGGYYAALSQYRYPEREASEADAEALAFLPPPRELAGDGQPENIGYGYQKPLGSSGGGYTGGSVRDVTGAERPSAKALRRLLLEDAAAAAAADWARYHGSKRSVFRERSGDHLIPGAALARVVDTSPKRGNSMLPSSFRERVHSSVMEEDEDLEEEKLVRAIARSLEEEQEQEEEEREGQYLQLLQTLWNKYKEANPEVVDIEDLTPAAAEQLLAMLGDADDWRGWKAEAAKRQYGDSYGSGFDYFNNAGALNGWSSGGQYKKRGRQRLDVPGTAAAVPDGPQTNFLYSLKFVSPANNREAVETLKDDDAVELPDETDEDVLRAAAAGVYRQPPEVWVSRVSPDDLYSPDEDAYQRLSRKRKLERLIRPSDEYSARQRHFSDSPRSKRFPVTKRSPSFYTSPPLLHHQGLGAVEHMKDARKKKDAATAAVTDPKVARELNQIFSASPVANDDLSEENAHDMKVTPAVGTPASKHEIAMTTEASVVSNMTSSTSAAGDVDVVNGSAKNASCGGHEEQPISVGKLQGPLDIKKKSIDWSDYFGIDRRRKKTNGASGVPDSDWLMSEYWRALALSPGVTKRTSNDDVDDDERIENMDSKLRNIEDVIVNEAVKYTGAHEGATDPREIQDVKDKVLSRLAAAYSLEKMRLALREFKASLQAHRMSGVDDDDKKNKRVAIKKEDAKEDVEDKKKRQQGKPDDGTSSSNLLSDVEPLSEGYMGKARPSAAHEDCPLIKHILQRCRAVASLAGDSAQLFVPLCSLHQICYICGPEMGYASPSACDVMFLTEADGMCPDDAAAACQQVARRTAVTLRRRRPDANDEQCWSNSCVARYFLASPSR